MYIMYTYAAMHVNKTAKRVNIKQKSFRLFPHHLKESLKSRFSTSTLKALSDAILYNWKLNQ